MAGRIPCNLTDTEALRRLVKSTDSTVYDLRPIIAYTMSKTGATFKQVGDVLGVSRQRAEVVVKSFGDKL